MAGETIDFLLTAKRDTAAAKRFFTQGQRGIRKSHAARDQVDKNPAYPPAIEELNAEGAVPRRGALRQCKYLNNMIQQDHRTVKKRVWLAKGDSLGQAHFIAELFGLM